MSFPPNLTNEQVKELDRERGQGNTKFLDDNKEGEDGMKEATEILKSFLRERKEAPVVEEVEKALNSKSMPILRPRPEDDPFSSQRSAMTPTTRSNSRLNGANGTAPLVGETVQDVSDNEYVRTHQTFKSCIAHGVLYKSDGCPQCTFSKSMECQDCGQTLSKGPGGNKYCAKGCGSAHE